MTASPRILVVQPQAQAALWRAALLALGCDVRALERDAPLAFDGPPCALLVADVAELATRAVDPGTAAAAVAAHGGRLLLTVARRLEVAGVERRWAQGRGAIDLVPALSPGPRTVDALCRLAAELGIRASDAERLRAALAEAGDDGPASRLARGGIEPAEIGQRMRGDAGVARTERRYRLKWYADCFVGSEAVDWIVQGYGLSREDAVAVGQRLLDGGLLHHVVKEQPFRDGFFYYRFSATHVPIAPVEVDALAARMRAPGGVPLAERAYLGRRIPESFVGREAVDWLAATFALGREDALALGQRLVDLGLAHHVLGPRDFLDAGLYYRFGPWTAK
jgi:hypothetical protein